MLAADSAAFISGHGSACSRLYSASFSGFTPITMPMRWTMTYSLVPPAVMPDTR